MSAEGEILEALERLIQEDCAESLLELEEADGERVLPLVLEREGPYGQAAPAQAKLSISGAELTEKDRILKNERYTATATITAEGERPDHRCYRYAQAIELALRGDPTLGGIAASATLTKKDYRFPTVARGGEPYRAVLTVAVVKERL